MVFLGHGIKLKTISNWTIKAMLEILFSISTMALTITSQKLVKSQVLATHYLCAHLHTSHTVICPQIAQIVFYTHSTHTHRHTHIGIDIPACIVPKLASSRGRCHGWVNPEKEGAAQQHWWAELLSFVASCLDRMGIAAAQGHVALRGVWEDRHGDSAVERVHEQSSFTPSFQSITGARHWSPSPPRSEGARLGCVISKSAIQPSRDKLSFTCWWAQRSPTHYNCTSTHSQRTPHAYKLRPTHTPSHTRCHGVLSNTRAVMHSQWAYLEN